MTPKKKKNPPLKSAGNPRIFRKILFSACIIIIGVAALNVLFNQPHLQNKTKIFLKEKWNIDVAFDDLTLNIFTGSLSGKNLDLRIPDSHFEATLQSFDIRLHVLWLFVGRIQLAQIKADAVHLLMINQDKKSNTKKTQTPKPLPAFLTRIRLDHADIKKFSLERSDKGLLYVESLTLQTHFRGLLLRGTSNLSLKNLKLFSPKFDAFLGTLKQEGVFTFDLSSAQLFENSLWRIQSKLQDVTLAFNKKPKPWLTTPAWDDDMTPILQRLYLSSIPSNRTFLHLQSAELFAEKNQSSFEISKLHAEIFSGQLIGYAHFDANQKTLTAKISTPKKIPLSKLPLGQMSLRDAFGFLELDLSLEGPATLAQHNLKWNAKLTARDNRINKIVGDLTLQGSGNLSEGRLSSENLVATLGDGKFNIQGFADLMTKQFSLNGHCEKFDVHTTLRLFSSVNAPAIASCNGSLRGFFNNPSLHLNITSDDAGYEFIHFGPAIGELTIDNKRLILAVKTTTNKIGTSHLDLAIENVFDGFEQILKLSSDHHDIPLKAALAAERLDGRLNGHYEMTRVKTVNAGRGDFYVNDFDFFGQRIGKLTGELILKARHLEITPFQIVFKDPEETVKALKPIAFDFSDTGYEFTAPVFSGLDVKGNFEKKNPENLHLIFDAKNFSLNHVVPIFGLNAQASSLSGKFDLNYQIETPLLSEMKGQANVLRMQLPEANIELLQPTILHFANRAFQFKALNLRAGNGKMILDGALNLEGDSNLHVKGDVDFNGFSDFNPMLVETEKPIALDLTFRGTFSQPRLFGNVRLDHDAVVLRNFSGTLEDINGVVTFNDMRLSMENLSFLYDDAPMIATGWLIRNDSDAKKIAAADLQVKGSDVPVHLSGGLDLTTDLNLRLHGSASKLLLEGRLNIIDGQYTQSFGLTDFILKPQETIETESFGTDILPESTRLTIHVTSSGDFLIKNNLMELELRTDLDVNGTATNPSLFGQVDVIAGTINAMGVSFEDAEGFAQFDGKNGFDPIVNLTAKKEIQQYDILAKIQGRSSNMRLRLDSIPSLDRRDILAILFYGQTPDQLVGDRRQQFKQTAAISQLASVLSKPIHKISGLDVVQVSNRQLNANKSQQRLSVGKSFSKRLNLLFTTDLGIADPERAFELQYQVFDNLYLIAAKDIGRRDRYRFDINLRLETY